VGGDTYELAQVDAKPIASRRECLRISEYYDECLQYTKVMFCKVQGVRSIGYDVVQNTQNLSGKNKKIIQNSQNLSGRV